MKSLKELVDVEILEEIQSKFAVATNVAVIICDADGVPLTKASNFTGFCTYIRSSSEGLRRCILSDENVGKMAAAHMQPMIHRCHAGLVDFAAPIILRNQYLGSVLCGQILIEDYEIEDLPDMRVDLSELPLNQNKLTFYFNELERKTKSRVQAIAELLFVAANYIVKICDDNLTKEELANKTEKLVEELQLRSQLEKTLRETQLKVLQSQVNPHFLFNTLNTISRIAYFERADQTQQVTFMLGKILRYSLRNIDQLVPLKDEIEHVQNYIAIQKTRFRDKIHTEFRINESIEQISIPIFTIQPIIENAIVHGFEPVGEPITITIKAYEEGGNIIIEIIDDGIGIEEGEFSSPTTFPSRKQKGHTTGIGLENVDKRIKHYFGNQWGIRKIARRNAGGTFVQMMFPGVETQY